MDPDQLADLGLYFLKKNIHTGKFCSSHAAFGLNGILLSVKPNILEGPEYENMSTQLHYEGGSICNENPLITPSINALGFNAICQTKDQSVAVIMVYETLFNFSKCNKLQTF